MNILKRIIGFFIKAKAVTETTLQKVDKFVKEHKRQIKLLMTVLEAIFPAKTGAKKMACVVTNICTAIGYEAASEDVIAYIENKCQDIYNEFKEGLE